MTENVISKETARIASILANLAQGLANRRINLEVAEQFVSSGKIERAPGLPAIGSQDTLPCPMCEKETRQLLTIAPYSSKEPEGDQVIRWVCCACYKTGPIIVRVPYA